MTAQLKKREYYGFSGWKDREDWGTVEKQFSTMLGKEPEYVYAVYSTPAYEGNATVVYKQGGKWFEARGGHCSCYGLEGQWEPTPIDPSLHLKARKEGRTMIFAYDSEGDYPEATQERFDKWLAWAVER